VRIAQNSLIQIPLGFGGGAGVCGIVGREIRAGPGNTSSVGGTSFRRGTIGGASTDLEFPGPGQKEEVQDDGSVWKSVRN